MKSYNRDILNLEIATWQKLVKPKEGQESSKI